MLLRKTDDLKNSIPGHFLDLKICHQVSIWEALTHADITEF